MKLPFIHQSCIVWEKINLSCICKAVEVLQNFRIAAIGEPDISFCLFCNNIPCVRSKKDIPALQFNAKAIHSNGKEGLEPVLPILVPSLYLCNKVRSLTKLISHCPSYRTEALAYERSVYKI